VGLAGKEFMTDTRIILFALLALLVGCPTSSDDDDDADDDDTANDDDDDTANDDDDDDDDDSANPVGLFPGYCPLEDRIGQVRMHHYSGGNLTLYAQVRDQPDPQVGAPELTNASCDYHLQGPTCTGCTTDEVCSFEGKCVKLPSLQTDLMLDVTLDGTTTTLQADESGYAFGQLATALEDPLVDLTLTWSGGSFVVEGFGLPRGNIAPEVDIEGTYEQPGALTSTWTDSGLGAYVSSLIPINHHVGGPTYTWCRAEESAGSWVADAGMIDPLAVVTGLEFQGLNYEHVLAGWTAQGCVEFKAGTRLYPF